MEKIKLSELDAKLKIYEYLILDFGSPGCSPCKKVPSIIEEALSEISGKNVQAYFVDITEEAPIAQRYFVLGVPTVIVFKQGKEIARFGSVPKKDKIIQALS